MRDEKSAPSYRAFARLLHWADGARRLRVRANADTPNYQARDLDFSSALDGAFAAATRLKTTDPRHIAGTPLSSGNALKYRVPHQPSLDGNTVEADLEQARYAENAVSYQASLLFAGNRISTLRAALTGGR